MRQHSNVNLMIYLPIWSVSASPTAYRATTATTTVSFFSRILDNWLMIFRSEQDYLLIRFLSYAALLPTLLRRVLSSSKYSPKTHWITFLMNALQSNTQYSSHFRSISFLCDSLSQPSSSPLLLVCGVPLAMGDCWTTYVFVTTTGKSHTKFRGVLPNDGFYSVTCSTYGGIQNSNRQFVLSHHRHARLSRPTWPLHRHTSEIGDSHHPLGQSIYHGFRATVTKRATADATWWSCAYTIERKRYFSCSRRNQRLRIDDFPKLRELVE